MSDIPPDRVAAIVAEITNLSDQEWGALRRFLVAALSAAPDDDEAIPDYVAVFDELVGSSPELVGVPLEQLINDSAAPVPAPTEAEEGLGLSIDMTDVSRLQAWAHNLLTHGGDVTHWAAVPFLASKLEDIATRMDITIREIGKLRRLSQAGPRPASGEKG